ncbi:MAG: CrcB family protein, partial [Bdellovibrionales bacterium]|nr:CrcB family protein [Bdellovibrionales bacterium]
MGFLFIYLDKTSPQLKTWICVAFLGAFTTFSSFSLDIIRLIDQGALKMASFYFLSTTLLCISGCYMGWIIAKNMVTNS